MKKYSLVILCVLTFLALIVGACSSPSGGDGGFIQGTGDSPSSPILINNEESLRKVGTGDWGLNKHYKQIADIKMLKPFTPIGNNLTPFTGRYNGGNHTITNLTITNTDPFTGLFGYVSGDGTTTGIIENVGLINCSISGEHYIGGVVGYMYNGTVQNCYVVGNVEGNMNVGGIVGYILNSGTVQNCYATGSITGTGTNSPGGGIVGRILNNGTVQNCYSTSNVEGYYVGGLLGFNSGTVQNCVALNLVIKKTSGSNTEIGRVAGYNGSTLTNNYARSDMTMPNINYTPDIGPNKKDGADLTVTGSGTANETVFAYSNGWSSSDWDIPDGYLSETNRKLPTLKNMPGAAQNPQLP